MGDPAIERHCRQIDRCNQRGGRMLSIVDLIEAGTMTRDLAAYALAAIGGKGASFLVGALPGGAGKTTVMGALLNLVPEVELLTADGLSTIQQGLASRIPRRCYICHEIGAGPYYGYLWGEELRAYLRLASAGHMLATNLHADTYQQAHDQLRRDNRVPAADVRRVQLMFFLSVDRNGGGAGAVSRRIAEVWESDGTGRHRAILSAGASSPRVEDSRLISQAEVDRARQVVEGVLSSGARTIEQVRSAILRACVRAA